MSRPGKICPAVLQRDSCPRDHDAGAKSHIVALDVGDHVSFPIRRAEIDRSAAERIAWPGSFAISRSGSLKALPRIRPGWRLTGARIGSGSATYRLPSANASFIASSCLCTVSTQLRSVKEYPFRIFNAISAMIPYVRRDLLIIGNLHGSALPTHTSSSPSPIFGDNRRSFSNMRRSDPQVLPDRTPLREFSRSFLTSSCMSTFKISLRRGDMSVPGERVEPGLKALVLECPGKFLVCIVPKL